MNLIIIEKNILLEIHKVKGHSGNTFNEYVDKIAKEQVLLARQDKEGQAK